MEMNKVEYEQMAAMEKFYWWHVGRNHIIETQLNKIVSKKPAKILNIGCGTGGTIPYLEKFGEVTNVDTSPEVVKYLEQNGIANVVLVDGLKLPFKANSFDVVVGFDVLEHIEDEETALNEWRRVLRPGGKMFLTVPAYQWLWSDHDVSLHHFRRYTKKRLKAKVVQSRFEPAKLSYAIVFSLPLIVGFRSLNKLKNTVMKKDEKQGSEMTSYVAVPAFANSLLARILIAESWLLQHVNYLFGTTVMAIAEKPED